MDPLTHCLVGITIANLGLKDAAPEAGWLVVGAAVLPDLDYVTRLWGDRSFLRYHRGFSHSLVGIGLSSALLAGVFYLLWPSSGYWVFFFLSLTGLCSHLILDFLTPHGERLLSPFSEKWYARERFIFFDPYLLTLLGGGLILSGIFSRGSQVISGSVFLALIIYWAIREWSYQRCRRLLTDIPRQRRELIRADLSPIPSSPLVWRLIGEAEDEYFVARVNAFTLVPEEERRLAKPVRDEYISRAEQSEVVKRFLLVAKYPFVESRPRGDKRVIIWWDLASIHREKKPQVRVILSEKNEILEEGFIIRG
jgi:inner membrane protein